MHAPDYSVVVPVYNSAATIEKLFSRLQAVFERHGASFECIFVEDCGTDNSWEVIRDLQKQNPSIITGIKLGRNFGQHCAIMCGFAASRGKRIVTIDDDLQIPPEEIPKLIAKMDETNCDIVFGYPENKQHNAGRNLGSQLIQWVMRKVFKSSGPVSPFRLLTHDLVKKITTHKHRFVYLDGLAFWHTQYVQHVPTEHLPRQTGRSGYSYYKLVKLASNLFLNFSTTPLRLVVYVGFTVGAISFLYGTIVILRKFLYQIPAGYSSIIVSVLFCSGIIITSLGVVGEYITRMYSLLNESPQYSVRQVQGPAQLEQTTATS